MVLIYGAVYKMATFNSLFVKKKKKRNRNTVKIQKKMDTNQNT